MEKGNRNTVALTMKFNNRLKPGTMGGSSNRPLNEMNTITTTVSSEPQVLQQQVMEGDTNNTDNNTDNTDTQQPRPSSSDSGHSVSILDTLMQGGDNYIDDAAFEVEDKVKVPKKKTYEAPKRKMNFWGKLQTKHKHKEEMKERDEFYKQKTKKKWLPPKKRKSKAGTQAGDPSREGIDGYLEMFIDRIDERKQHDLAIFGNNKKAGYTYRAFNPTIPMISSLLMKMSKYCCRISVSHKLINDGNELWGRYGIVLNGLEDGCLTLLTTVEAMPAHYPALKSKVVFYNVIGNEQNEAKCDPEKYFNNPILDIDSVGDDIPITLCALKKNTKIKCPTIDIAKINYKFEFESKISRAYIIAPPHLLLRKKRDTFNDCDNNNNNNNNNNENESENENGEVSTSNFRLVELALLKINKEKDTELLFRFLEPTEDTDLPPGLPIMQLWLNRQELIGMTTGSRHNVTKMDPYQHSATYLPRYFERLHHARSVSDRRLKEAMEVDKDEKLTDLRKLNNLEARKRMRSVIRTDFENPDNPNAVADLCKTFRHTSITEGATPFNVAEYATWHSWKALSLALENYISNSKLVKEILIGMGRWLQENIRDYKAIESCATEYKAAEIYMKIHNHYDYKTNVGSEIHAKLFMCTSLITQTKQAVIIFRDHGFLQICYKICDYYGHLDKYEEVYHDEYADLQKWLFSAIYNFSFNPHCKTYFAKMNIIHAIDANLQITNEIKDSDLLLHYWGLCAICEISVSSEVEVEVEVEVEAEAEKNTTSSSSSFSLLSSRKFSNPNERKDYLLQLLWQIYLKFREQDDQEITSLVKSASRVAQLSHEFNQSWDLFMAAEKVRLDEEAAEQLRLQNFNPMADLLADPEE